MSIANPKSGDRARTTDGSIVDILSATPDGQSVQVCYVECERNPTIVGTEAMRSIDEIAERINKYPMTISRLTVDKLGVKLYDRVSAVLAELIANSYDADATSIVDPGIWTVKRADWRW